MSVHRIDDRAEYLLQRIAASEHKSPGAILTQLVKEYAKGLTWNDPDLLDIPAPAA